jgi:hypothetical protein
MKKFFATLLLVALCLAPAFAGAATISLSGTGGAIVSVTVTVAGIEALAEPSLGAFDLDLGYDPSVLAFSDVEFDTFLGGPDDSFQDEVAAGGVVDFAEISLLFPNVVLQALQPDSFALATVYFTSLVSEVTLTTLTLTQALLSDGNGRRIAVSVPLSIELEAAIPEAGGAHVFALGILVALAGHLLLRPRS